MSDHLTSRNVAEYAARVAEPETLLVWDDHLAECAECRGKLPPARGLAEWGAGLCIDDDALHLTQEQLIGRASNTVSDSDRFAVESHVKQCASCREELADLVQFRHTMKARPSRVGWVWAAAAAAVVVGFFALHNASGPNPLSLPATWSAQDRQLVEQALNTGALPIGAAPSDVASKPGTLLGPSTQNAFSPLSPLGRIVESDRPQFDWQELAGATSYRIEVYDADFNLVVASPSLIAIKWTPEQPLARGKLYHWQVTATKKGETITVPAPPASQADFRVLDQATEARVEQARASGGMGHLLAATLLAQAGMDTEVSSELAQLPEDARRDPKIAKLLAKP